MTATHTGNTCLKHACSHTKIELLLWNLNESPYFGGLLWVLEFHTNSNICPSFRCYRSMIKQWTCYDNWNHPYPTLGHESLVSVSQVTVSCNYSSAKLPAPWPRLACLSLGHQCNTGSPRVVNLDPKKSRQPLGWFKRGIHPTEHQIEWHEYPSSVNQQSWACKVTKKKAGFSNAYDSCCVGLEYFAIILRFWTLLKNHLRDGKQKYHQCLPSSENSNRPLLFAKLVSFLGIDSRGYIGHSKRYLNEPGYSRRLSLISGVNEGSWWAT